MFKTVTDNKTLNERLWVISVSMSKMHSIIIELTGNSALVKLLGKKLMGDLKTEFKELQKNFSALVEFVTKRH